MGEAPREPRQGDFILLTPYDRRGADDERGYVADHYEAQKLFETRSPLYPVCPTLRTFMRRLLKLPPDTVDFYLYRLR
jgi:hypothetical protein